MLGIILVSDEDFRGYICRDDKYIIKTKLEKGKVLKQKFILIKIFN